MTVNFRRSAGAAELISVLGSSTSRVEHSSYEVSDLLDMTTGKLGLTNTEENQIVAFLMTLTDGFTTAVSRYQYLHWHMHDGRDGGDPGQ